MFSAFGLGLPLLDVADETAHAPLLAARLAAVLRAVARGAEPLAPRRALRREHRRAAVHREAIAAAVGGALVHLLGLHSRRGGHVPAVVRVDSFRDGGAAQERYQAFVFGLRVFTFDLASPLAPLVFNVLDISAVLVIAGVSLAMWRRGRDRGALAVQQFGADLLPLVMLFAVSITGVFLTVSTHLMRGLHFVFLSQLHAVTVIFTLLYLPLRQVLPHLPAARAARRRLLSRDRREGRGGPLRAMRRTVRVADAHRRSQAGRARAGNQYDAVRVKASAPERYGRALSGHLSGLPPQEPRADARRALEARRVMARLPASIPDLVAQFGPHLNREPAGGWTTRGEPDRIVPTHCCFCGQQCGIQLKVKDEKIVGFEPWEEFPFNKGKLCPKGVKRYMQDEHPDRLLTPLVRDEARGFQPIDWDTALDRTAREIQRIQSAYGQDAFAVLTGASLTNEKAYLMGKFARVGRADRQHRLQRPALHGVGGGRVEEDSRHRSQRQPVERHPEGEGDSRRGREHRRVRPDHHRLSLAGARRTAQSSSCSIRA